MPTKAEYYLTLADAHACSGKKRPRLIIPYDAFFATVLYSHFVEGCLRDIVYWPQGTLNNPGVKGLKTALEKVRKDDLWHLISSEKDDGKSFITRRNEVIHVQLEDNEGQLVTHSRYGMLQQADVARCVYSEWCRATNKEPAE